MSEDEQQTTETVSTNTASTTAVVNGSSRTASLAHYLLMGGIVLLVLSPLTYRTGLLDLGIALMWLFPAGIIASLLAILTGLAGIMTTRKASGRGKALTAVVGGLVVVGVVAMMIAPPMLANLPKIHDITTDTDNAPAFVALRDARDAAPNETDYVGGKVAAQQIAETTYQDLTTFESSQPGRVMFAAAEQIANDMGWDIVAVAPAEGRIEATATTRIYGFKDDVVIRIQPTMEGTTTVDVRSASRVGKGDLGANAARIQAFLIILQQATSE